MQEKRQREFDAEERFRVRAKNGKGKTSRGLQLLKKARTKLVSQSRWS